MSMKWVTHNGKKIITIDYSGMDENSILHQMQHYFDEIKNESEVRHLINFADIILTLNFREKAREMEISNTANKKVKIAMLGVNKYQKANVTLYSIFTKIKAQAFDSEKEALDWLAGD